MISQGRSSEAAADAAPGAASARREGRQAFTDAVRGALLDLPASGVQQIWMVDEAFVGWPLDDPTVLEALTAWCRLAGRQAKMIAADFAAVERSYPRFSSWRRDYVHCLSTWQPDASAAAGLDALIVAGPCAVELLDRERWQFRRSTDRVSVRAAVERVAEWLLRCEPAWPVTPVGL